MIPLPNTYKKYGYQFELLERNGDVAVFKQLDEGNVIAYEVFEVVKQEHSIRKFGEQEIEYPAKEHVPATERWGISAFTCSTIERAHEKANWLQNRVIERLANNIAAQNPFFAVHVAEISAAV